MAAASHTTSAADRPVMTVAPGRVPAAEGMKDEADYSRRLRTAAARAAIWLVRNSCLARSAGAYSTLIDPAGGYFGGWPYAYRFRNAAERVRSRPALTPPVAAGAWCGSRPAAGIGLCSGTVRRRQGRHSGVRPDAGEAAVRGHGMEDRAARSLVLPGRRLREGSRLLPGADELDHSQRRRQAGDARHRRLGRPRHSRWIRRAPGAAGCRRARRRCGCSWCRRPGRSARAAHGGVRRILLGHRAVGRENSGGRAEEARTDAGGRQPRRLPELPCEGSRRLRSADQQRQPQEPPPGTRQRQDLGAGAVRLHELEDRVARSHLVRGVELQGDRRVLHGAPRLDARAGRGQPEPVQDWRHRRDHRSSRKKSRRGSRVRSGAAARLDRAHLVRHRRL